TEGQDASRKSAWDLPVMPQVHERRKRREKPAAKAEEASATPKAPVAKEAAGDKSRGTRRGRDADRDDERGKKRFGTGKLHLSERDRARRGSGRRRGKTETVRTSGGAGPHGFSKPTAPVVREVAIGEANLVTELAQKMAIKGAEVVKALFKM